MSSEKQTFQSTAPAKANLVLKVLGKRPDTYHELQTIVAPLALSDVVSITLDYTQQERTCVIEGSLMSVQQKQDLAGPGNLAHKAAVLLLDSQPQTKGCGFAITIDKNIPLQAGLGGGSTNAAAVIRMLVDNKIFIGKIDLDQISRELGADIPCLIWPSLKFVSGRGEILEDITVPKSVREFLSKDLAIGIIKPREGVATADGYRALSREKLESHQLASKERDIRIKRFFEFLRKKAEEGETRRLGWFPEFIALLGNDFQNPIVARHAGVREIIEQVATLSPNVCPILSGSGSAVILFGPNSADQVGSLVAHFRRKGFFAVDSSIL